MKIALLSFICGVQLISAQINLPQTRTTDASDTYFGITYKDPYRWLEDIKNPETVQWFKSQADASKKVFNAISGRDSLIAEWTKLDKIQTSKIRSVSFENGRYFYHKLMAGESVAKLFLRNGISGDETLLFDPTTFIKGKTLSIVNSQPSRDGKLIAVTYTENGAEVGTIIIIDVDSKKILPESLYPTWDGVYSWTADNKAFTYSWLKTGDNTSMELSQDVKTKFHVIGTDVKTDLDYFSNEKYPDLKIASDVFPEAWWKKECPDYIFGKIGRVDNMRDYDYYYAPASEQMKKNISWKILSTRKDELVGDLTFKDNVVYAVSLKNAAKGRVLATPLSAPNWEKAEIIAEEKDNLVLQNILRSKDYLLMSYTDGVNAHLFRYEFATRKTVKVELPFLGSCLAQTPDKSSNHCILFISSWIKPITEYDFDVEKMTFSKGNFNQELIYPAAYNDLQTEEVVVKGHDGVMIPMSLIYKKGTKKDGSNICMMQGYGAYGNSITSAFDIKENTLAVKGVVVAIAHVRGGGEKGDDWYKGGLKTTKPNTWKDFISCAEYLIQNGFTSKGKIAGKGTSAGGIMIGRAITERPDLFRAAICNVGILNTMRFELTPNGPTNMTEFGSVKNEKECKALFEMDAFQHVVKGSKYPAVLCVAGWNDPRVIAWQPGKFAAALQSATVSDKPVLLKVNYDNGHFTQDRKVTIADYADQFAFAMWQCGHQSFQIPVKNK